MGTAELRAKIHRVVDVADPEYLEMLYSITQQYSATPVRLSEEEREAAEVGLADLRAGRIVSDAEAMTKLRKEFPNVGF